MVSVTAADWQRMPLRVPNTWLARITRWSLGIGLGLHLLGAFSHWLGASGPAFLRTWLPWQGPLFTPVAADPWRTAAAAILTALMVLTLTHGLFGRLTPWLFWLLLGAMAFLTVRGGETSSPGWALAWLVVSVACVLAAVPALRRAWTVRRWEDRGTTWTFIDDDAVQAQSVSRRWIVMVTGVVLIVICLVWNGIVRLVRDDPGTWPPSVFGDLLPWALGVVGLSLVIIDLARGLVQTVLRHGLGLLVVEFGTGGVGPVEYRVGSTFLPRDELEQYKDCGCREEEHRTNDEASDFAIPPARKCPRHGHRRLNELDADSFRAVAHHGWVWADGHGFWAEDLADFRNNPARVLDFGFEGLGGHARQPSLTVAHRRHEVRCVERERFSLLRRYPPHPPVRPGMAEAAQGEEVVDTIDLTPAGIAGTAVRRQGEYPVFVPGQRPDNQTTRTSG